MGADHEKQGGYDTQTISPWYYKFGINFWRLISHRYRMSSTLDPVDMILMSEHTWKSFNAMHFIILLLRYCLGWTCKLIFLKTIRKIEIKTKKSVLLHALWLVVYFFFFDFSITKACFIVIRPYWYCIGQIEASSFPPGHLTFLKIIVQIPPYPGQNAVQMPHSRVHSGDQMPPPRGHFTGTKMTEGRQKRLQLSNKIFINTANNSHSI